MKPKRLKASWSLTSGLRGAVRVDGKLRICKYNVDEANEYAAKLGIRSIPTLIVYENGQPIQQHVGSMGQSQLEDFLNQFV